MAILMVSVPLQQNEMNLTEIFTFHLSIRLRDGIKIQKSCLSQPISNARQSMIMTRIFEV